MNSNKISEKRKIVRDYIQNNPRCTYRDIKRDTKIKIERIYSNMSDAYIDANVPLSENLTKRSRHQQKDDVLNYIRNNPNCSIIDIHREVRANVIRLFGSIVNAYNLAGVEYVEKEVASGVRNPFVVKRSNKFEQKIFSILSLFGRVTPKVRIEKYIVDCIFEYGDKTFVVEIKDYRGYNNITMYEINQLLRYMKALNCNNGLLVCPKESFPKRKNGRYLNIDDKNIWILSDKDLFLLKKYGDAGTFLTKL